MKLGGVGRSFARVRLRALLLAGTGIVAIAAATGPAAAQSYTSIGHGQPSVVVDRGVLDELGPPPAVARPPVGGPRIATPVGPGRPLHPYRPSVVPRSYSQSAPPPAPAYTPAPAAPTAIAPSSSPVPAVPAPAAPPMESDIAGTEPPPEKVPSSRLLAVPELPNRAERSTARSEPAPRPAATASRASMSGPRPTDSQSIPEFARTDYTPPPLPTRPSSMAAHAATPPARPAAPPPPAPSRVPDPPVVQASSPPPASATPPRASSPRVTTPKVADEPPPPAPRPATPPAEAPRRAATAPAAPPPAPPAPPAAPDNTPSPPKAASPTPAPAPAQQANLPSAAPGNAGRVQFDANSAALSDAARQALDELSQRLAGNEQRIQVVAFAAGDGQNVSQARRLSLSRALAVRTYLIDKGIRSTRIDVRAMGAAQGPGPADRVDLVTANP